MQLLVDRPAAQSVLHRQWPDAAGSPDRERGMRCMMRTCAGSSTTVVDGETDDNN
jgi:hypothetical protein